MAMNPEIKARWIAALKSGEYHQGYNQLAYVPQDKPARHCCLGVLCELAAKAGVVERQADPTGEVETVSFAHEKNYLPEAVAAWAGLEPENFKGQFFVKNADGDEYAEDLASHNDMGQSFAEIADIIEQYF